MTSHEHDPELIMSLAEGRFAGDADSVRSELETCAECAADLAAQEAALAALGDLRQRTDVQLTEFEAASLRRHLDRELGHRRVSDRAATAKPRRSFSWAPVFSVAAVLLALLLVAPALDLLGGSDSDSGDAFDAAVNELEAGSSEAPVVEQMTVNDAGGDAREAAPAPPTTVSTAAAADGAADPATLQLFAILATVEGTDGDVEAMRSGISTAFGYSTATPPDACVEEGEAALGGTVSSTTLGDVVLVDGEPARTITVHRLTSGEYAVVAHDTQTCAVVAQAP